MHFVNFSPDNKHFKCKELNEKVFKILEHLLHPIHVKIYFIFVFSCSQNWHFMGSADDTRLKKNDIKMVWNKME